MMQAGSSQPTLRMRRDLVVRAFHRGARRYWSVKDPLALRYFQLREEEFWVLERLDGATRLEDIPGRFEREFAPQRLRMQQVYAFARKLHSDGLILSDGAGQGPVLAERGRRERRARIVRCVSNPLAIRFPGIDPGRMLDRLYVNCRWMLSRWFIAACTALVASALLLVAVEWRVVLARLPDMDAFFTTRAAASFLAALAMCKVLHELGHAIVCRHFGRQCHEMGLMLLFGTPCLYCDVSDAWLLPSKWQRIAITAAGVAVELVLAAAATILWWFSEPGWLNSLLLYVMLIGSVNTLLLNGNPLMHYDGYYILSDLVDVPNLRQQASAIVRAWIYGWFFGVETESPLGIGSAARGWMGAYTIAAAGYRVAVVAALWWLAHQFLKRHDLEALSWAFGAMLAASLIAPVMVSLVRTLSNPIVARRISWPRLLVRGLGLVAVLGLLSLAPLPARVDAPAVVELEGEDTVYVTAPGAIVEAKSVGSRVRTGVQIARLEDRATDLDVARLRGQRDKQQIEVTGLEARAVSDDAAAARLPAAREALADFEERLARRELDQSRLVLAAPRGGLILPAAARPAAEDDRERLPAWSGDPLDERNRGAYLPTGTMLCRVGDPDRIEAILTLDQGDVELVAPGQRVHLIFDERPAMVVEGTIIETAQSQIDGPSVEMAAMRDMPLRAGKRGTTQLVGAHFQARVSLEPHEARLLPGAHGRAKIFVAPSSLAARAARFVGRTFRFEL